MNLDPCSPIVETQIPTINLEQRENERASWRHRLGRVAAVSAMLVSGLAVGWANSHETSIEGETIANIEPAGQGAYDNAGIANKALSYVGQWGGAACRDAHMLDNGNQSTTVGGFNAGECRTFVNCIIALVSGGKQNIGWGQDDYFSALKANGQEITDVNTLKKGDIVQIGKDGTHTVIIVGHNAGKNFDVVASNHALDHKVSKYAMDVTLNSNERAFRLGQVASPPAPKPAPKKPPFDTAKYKNHIVEWDNGPGEQHTAWLVGDDGKRYWIPDIPTFWCLRDKGIPDDGVQTASVLDSLPDTGQWAHCTPEQHNDALNAPPMETIPPMTQPLPPKAKPVEPAPSPPPTAPPTTERPPDTIPPKRVLLHIYNKVTNGSQMREDSTPVRLTRSPHPFCNDDCLTGTERNTGGTYDAAVCQTHGPYDTNGNNHDASDDHNPGRYESTLYYGVRLADGRFGYTSDVWVSPDQRGGLDLPAC